MGDPVPEGMRRVRFRRMFYSKTNKRHRPGIWHLVPADWELPRALDREAGMMVDDFDEDKGPVPEASKATPVAQVKKDARSGAVAT